MNYTKIGNLHRIVRITGPAHNLLGIEFGSAGECIIERLGPSSSGLKDAEVKTWVLSAVAKANAELGMNLHVRRIQFVADDTPDRNVYELLACELVARAR